MDFNYSVNSISSLTINSDDLFKNRNFPQQFLQSLHAALENKNLIDIEIISEDGKRCVGALYFFGFQGLKSGHTIHLQTIFSFPITHSICAICDINLDGILPKSVILVLPVCSLSLSSRFFV